jgi:hypothetical protein
MARKLARFAGRASLLLTAVYVALSAALYAIMLRTPGEIAAAFNHVPWPAWVVLPMRPMWLHARGGTLQTGDEAPAFDLSPSDGTSRVSLSSLRGRPAVLVFGSYT